MKVVAKVLYSGGRARGVETAVRRRIMVSGPSRSSIAGSRGEGEAYSSTLEGCTAARPSGDKGRKERTKERKERKASPQRDRLQHPANHYYSTRVRMKPYGNFVHPRFYCLVK